MVKINGKSYVHRQYLEIMQTPCSVPLCDGAGLREIANLNSMIQALEEHTISPEQGVFFPAAFLSVEIEEILRARAEKSIFLGDAFPSLGLPWLIRPFRD